MTELVASVDQNDLINIFWKDGKEIPIMSSVYRYEIRIVCSVHGRQRAEFANGEFPFFETVLLRSPDGVLSGGADIVPVLPDGRIIMVIERRAPKFRFSCPRMAVLRGGRVLDLRGGSLEIPGGSIDVGEEGEPIVGLRRELTEETGIPPQDAMLYYQKEPTFAFDADISYWTLLAVVYLTKNEFKDWVDTDGGLKVVALWPDEVERNIDHGVINSGISALMGWRFYRRIQEEGILDRLIGEGAVIRKTVRVGE